MKDFRDLKVWEKAHALVLACYEISKTSLERKYSGLFANTPGCFIDTGKHS